MKKVCYCVEWSHIWSKVKAATYVGWRSVEVNLKYMNASGAKTGKVCPEAYIHYTELKRST